MQEKINMIRNLVADWLRRLERRVRQCEPQKNDGARLTLGEAKLQRAAADFENARMWRLHEKVKEKYTGWDNNRKIKNSELIERAQEKLDELKLCPDNLWTQAEDIANYMNFIWHRNKERASA
jgi:hypothetical protein